MQGNISYYFPTREEAELLMKKGYLPFDEALKSLQIFFRKNGEDTDEGAEFLCKRVQFMLRIGETPESIIEMLEEGFMGFEDVMENYKKQMNYLYYNLSTNFSNHNSPPYMCLHILHLDYIPIELF